MNNLTDRSFFAKLTNCRLTNRQSNVYRRILQFDCELNQTGNDLSKVFRKEDWKKGHRIHIVGRYPTHCYEHFHRLGVGKSLSRSSHRPADFDLLPAKLPGKQKSRPHICVGGQLFISDGVWSTQ